MLVLCDFFSTYCRNDLCRLQSFAASCQKRLPAAIGPVTTAVAQMKNTSRARRGWRWSFAVQWSPDLRMLLPQTPPVFFFLSASHWSHDGARSFGLWWVYLSCFCLLWENRHPISSHQRKGQWSAQSDRRLQGRGAQWCEKDLSLFDRRLCSIFEQWIYFFWTSPSFFTFFF